MDLFAVHIAKVAVIFYNLSWWQKGEFPYEKRKAYWL